MNVELTRHHYTTSHCSTTHQSHRSAYTIASPDRSSLFILWLLADRIVEAELRLRHFLGHCLSLLLQYPVKLIFVGVKVVQVCFVLSLCLGALLVKVRGRNGRMGLERLWRSGAINTGGEGASRDTYLGFRAEQGTDGESTIGKTLGLVLPLSDMAFMRLGFLLGILDGNVFAMVGLENRADIRSFVNSDG